MVLHLPRDAVSVPVSRQVLSSCLDILGVTPDTRDDIALALSEACANVIQHAGPGDEYEVHVTARNRACVIEVVNTGPKDGQEDLGPLDGGLDRPDAFDLADAMVPATAEHGRGLKIIDAVADNVKLIGDKRHGTTVHFEKTLQWLPGATGQQLFEDENEA